MAKSLHISLFLVSATISNLQAMEKLIDVRNAAGWTPLHTAVSVGNTEVAKKLLELGARIDARALPLQRTPLMLSAEYNKNTIAEILLKNGALVDQTDNENATALHIACKKGHVDVVETLVLAGASVAVTPDFGNTGAVYHALAYKDYSDPTVLITLQKSCKKLFDIKNASQEFALHRACQADSAEGLEEMVLKGARIEELDKSGNSALHYVATNTNGAALFDVLSEAVKKKAQLATGEPVALSLTTASLPVEPSSIKP